MRRSLIRKTAVILALTVAFGLISSVAYADDKGSIKALVSDDERAAGMAEAYTVMDVYCLATWDGTKGEYVLTEAYTGLEAFMVDTKDMEESDAAEAGKKAGQKALEITFADGSKAVPVNKDGIKLGEACEGLPSGWYMALLHGSDLTSNEYYKTVKTDGSEDVRVTISQNDTTVYRFSPVLLTVNSNGEPSVFEVKAEEVPRYGSLRITKSVLKYNKAHSVSFVFKITGVDDDGTEKYVNYTGITFPDQKEVTVDHIPADLTYTVSEIYTGSNMVQVGSDPDPVKIVAGEQTTVDLEGSGSIVSVNFTNDYDYEEEEGNGIVNTFKYNGTSWDFYKDGVKQ